MPVVVNRYEQEVGWREESSLLTVMSGSYLLSVFCSLYRTSLGMVTSVSELT